MKTWQEWSGDQLRVNGLDRGPEFLPILHLALDLFFQIRTLHIKQKLSGIPKTYIEVLNELKFDAPLADVNRALTVLKDGNFIHSVIIRDVPVVAFTEAVERHLSQHAQFGTRDSVMFHLVIGTKLG